MLRMVAFCCLFITAASACASEAALRGFLDNVDTLQASFDQQVVDESGMILDFAQGNVYLSRPGKFRWDYEGEGHGDENGNGSVGVRGQQLVADGKSIFLFDPGLEQVTQRSMDDAITQVPSMLLVQNASALERFFSISDIGLTDGLSWVALKPKSEDAAYQQLLLGFKDGVLNTIQLFDGLGNETQIRLSEVINNADIDSSVFEFVVPKGVDLLSE